MLCLQKDVLVEILILSVPQSQMFLFNVYKVKNVQAQRVITITVTSFWAEVFFNSKKTLLTLPQIANSSSEDEDL